MTIPAISNFPTKTTIFPRALLLPAVIVVVISMLAFVRGLNNQFIAEDFLFIDQFNGSFGEAWQQMMDSSRLWPVGVAYRWVQFQFFGVNPVGYHLISLLVHCVNALLVYQMIKEMSGRQEIGLATAIIFSLYPRHHQSVSWMAANLVPLSSLLSLICIYAFWRFVRSMRSGWTWYVVSCISLFLALLTLEASIVLLPLMLALDFVLSLNEFNWRKPGQVIGVLFKKAPKYIPIALIFVAFFFLSFGGNRAYKLSGQTLTEEQFQEQGLAAGDTYHFAGIGVDTVKSLVSYVVYSALPLLPLRALDTGIVAAAVTGLICLALLIAFIKGNWVVRFGVLFLVISVLPYPLFATFGNADRYFYMAGIGFAIILAYLIYFVAERAGKLLPVQSKSVSFGLLGVYLFASVFVVQTRLDDWRRAGEIGDNIVQSAQKLFPNPEPGTSMLFVAMPRAEGQAYVFASGLATALELAYSSRAEDVIFYQSFEAGVSNYLASASPVSKTVDKLIVLTYENGQLVDRTNLVSDVEQLMPETWENW